MKRLKKIIVIIFPLILFLSSCTSTHYNQAFMMTCMPPPISNPNSKYEQNTMFIGFDLSNAQRYNGREQNYIVRTHFLYLEENEHSEANIGLTLFTGNYTVKKEFGHQGDYDFYGIGPELNANAFFPTQDGDFGIGIYGAYILELGDYLQFRRDSDDENWTNNFIEKGQFYAALYPIFKFHFSEMSTLSFQCGVGTPGFISPSLAYHHEKYTIWGTWIPLYINADDDNIYKYGSFSLGAGYKF